MVEKYVQTYVRAPNGELYCIDDEGQAFRSVSGPGSQTLDTSAQETRECHVMPDHLGAHIIPEADLPRPEGAHILPDGIGANIVPDQMAAHTVPVGIGANILPGGTGNGIVPDGVGAHIVPDGLGQ